MASIIQIRRDLASNWSAANPILAQGELGVELDTNKFKVGNGTSGWNSLSYLIDVGSYITESSSNTLTNKTINIANNTLTGVAPLASPTFTGTPTAPTATVGTSTTQLATTAFVGTTVTNERSATATLSNKTLTGPVINNGAASGLTLNDGYTEEVFAVTGTTPALSPTNGSIQTWTLSGNSTPTAGTWAAGQSITLMVDDGSAATITWTSLAVTWKTDGGSAPTLNTTGFTVIALWKVGSVVYGARVGDA